MILQVDTKNLLGDPVVNAVATSTLDSVLDLIEERIQYYVEEENPDVAAYIVDVARITELQAVRTVLREMYDKIEERKAGSE